MENILSLLLGGFGRTVSTLFMAWVMRKWQEEMEMLQIISKAAERTIIN
jgi:hypothetical protein